MIILECFCLFFSSYGVRHTRYGFFKNVDASLNVILGHVLNGLYEGLYVPVRVTNKISDNNYNDMIQAT